MSPTPKEKLHITLGMIRHLKGGGEQSTPWHEIRGMMDTITEGHLFLGGHITHESKWHRGRMLEPKGTFDELHELTARPPEKVSSFGRCHAPGVSVLYASNNIETVFSEISAAVFDRIQTIKLRIKNNEEVMFTTIGEIDHVRRHNTHSPLLGQGYADKIRSHWDKIDEASRLRLNLVDAFIADQFCRPVRHPYDYKVTSAVSDIIFAQGIDCFLYPSVGHHGGWNIVIKKEVFDKKFEVIDSQVDQIITVIGYGMFGHGTERESQSINGNKIVWPEV